MNIYYQSSFFICFNCLPSTEFKIYAVKINELFSRQLITQYCHHLNNYLSIQCNSSILSIEPSHWLICHAVVGNASFSSTSCRTAIANVWQLLAAAHLLSAGRSAAHAGPRVDPRQRLRRAVRVGARARVPQMHLRQRLLWRL